MLVTADQIVCHLIGDYLLQSDWMAQNKTKSTLAASVHANVYSLPFLLLSPSYKAMLLISMSHFLIDRYRLARYVVWAKNFLAPKRPWAQWEPGEVPPELYRANRPMLPFRFCAATGYPPDTPAWLSTWLLIIADNILHIVINAIALRWL